MKFVCEDAQFVELEILGYEFPDISNETLDDDWLIVYINVESNDAHWKAREPAITTFELKKLVKWFESIGVNQGRESRSIDFTEPNLSFELLNDFSSEVKEIAISLGYEFYPMHSSDYYNDKYCMKFNATNEELKKYVEELKKEMEKYPERT